MATYVSKITVEGTTLYFFDKCGDIMTEIDLCPIIALCQGQTPVEEKPGDWPNPIDPGGDVRCRVAIKLGEIAAERLDNYLGLNLDVTVPGVPETWAATKIGQYGWPITIWNDLRAFTYSLYDGLTAGRGKDAKTEYDTISATIITNVQQALYCALGEDGQITSQTRGFWSINLSGLSGAFYDVLHDFVSGWPLEDLRKLAFEASTTTDEVDCGSFDCEGNSGDCGDTIDAQFEGQIIANYGFVAIESGSTSEFPDFQPTPFTFETTRQTSGWRVGTFCTSGNSPCEAIGIIREFETPFRLCNVNAVISCQAANGSYNTANSRIGAIYVKYAGSSSWTQLDKVALGINVTPGSAMPSWDGFAEIDALAVIGLTGGQYSVIRSVQINI